MFAEVDKKQRENKSKNLNTPKRKKSILECHGFYLR